MLGQGQQQGLVEAVGPGELEQRQVRRVVDGALHHDREDHAVDQQHAAVDVRRQGHQGAAVDAALGHAGVVVLGGVEEVDVLVEELLEIAAHAPEGAGHGDLVDHALLEPLGDVGEVGRVGQGQAHGGDVLAGHPVPVGGQQRHLAALGDVAHRAHGDGALAGPQQPVAEGDQRAGRGRVGQDLGDDDGELDLGVLHVPGHAVDVAHEAPRGIGAVEVPRHGVGAADAPPGEAVAAVAVLHRGHGAADAIVAQPGQGVGADVQHVRADGVAGCGDEAPRSHQGVARHAGVLQRREQGLEAVAPALDRRGVGGHAVAQRAKGQRGLDRGPIEVDQPLQGHAVGVPLLEPTGQPQIHHGLLVGQRPGVQLGPVGDPLTRVQVEDHGGGAGIEGALDVQVARRIREVGRDLEQRHDLGGRAEPVEALVGLEVEGVRVDVVGQRLGRVAQPVAGGRGDVLDQVAVRGERERAVQGVGVLAAFLVGYRDGVHGVVVVPGRVVVVPGGGVVVVARGRVVVTVVAAAPGQGQRQHHQQGRQSSSRVAHPLPPRRQDGPRQGSGQR